MEAKLDKAIRQIMALGFGLFFMCACAFGLLILSPIIIPGFVLWVPCKIVQMIFRIDTTKLDDALESIEGYDD